MGNWVDFDEVKSAVSIEMALARYSVELRQVNGGNFRGHCPLPMHGERSKGKAGSFSVSTAKNVWACQSAPCAKARGRKGGNVLDFVAAMEHCSVREAALKLHGWFLNGSQSPKTETAPEGAVTPQGAEVKRQEEAPTSGEAQYNRPLSFQLKLEPEHPYPVARGLSREIIERFGLGFCRKGLMAGRIAIPIHDEQGALVAYAGRWTGTDGELPDGEGRYKLPPNFHKNRVVFNLHRVPKDAKTVTVVEGFFSVFWLSQAGFANVVALMGSSMSERQAELLVERFKGVRLFLDGDVAGREAAPRCALAAADRTWVRLVDCPEGKQPDGLSVGELKRLLA